jgi:hypothetical protein
MSKPTLKSKKERNMPTLVSGQNPDSIYPAVAKDLGAC